MNGLKRTFQRVRKSVLQPWTGRPPLGYRPGRWVTEQIEDIGDTSATQKSKWQQGKMPRMPRRESRIVDERIKFIADVLRGDQNMTELCQIYNISRKAVSGIGAVRTRRAGSPAAKLSSRDTGSGRERDPGIALQASDLGSAQAAGAIGRDEEQYRMASNSHVSVIKATCSGSAAQKVPC
jgi:hypothetical protein